MNATRIGIIASVASAALFAVAMYAILANAEEDDAGNSVGVLADHVRRLQAQDPATIFEDVIVEDRATGTLSTRRYARYIDGASVRRDVFNDRGFVRATTIRSGLANFTCAWLTGRCERIDLQPGARM